MKKISLKELCLDIYSPNLIHFNLGDLTSWSEIKDFDNSDFCHIFFM